MSSAIYQGTFVHCRRLGELEILKNHVICVNEQGYISDVLSGSSAEASSLAQNSDVTITKLEDGAFFVPTFCDLHLHAPQFLYQGTGLHLPLMKWLDEYAFKSEEQLDNDSLLAERVYNKLAQRLLESGTGAVSLFGTLNIKTNLILAKVMQQAGLRAFVGKLSMDISSRPTYKEDSASASLSSVEEFIQQTRDFLSQYPPHLRLVEPIITPRFVPTCSNDLLRSLGDLAQSQSVRVQSHLAEAREEVEWVKSERQLDDIVVFEQSNLLSSQTIQAHCTFLHGTELEKMATYGSSVAHCPLSNCYFSEKPFPLREALSRGVKVGLGTDIAGGYSVDIMNSMRQAVSVSRMREGLRAVEAEIGGVSQHQGHQPLSINWKEALYLATRGGALAMDLPKIGSFEMGQAFDAQSISVYTADGTGVGAIDIFDNPGGITEELVEKWWCMGDERNRLSVWVQGKRVR